MLYIGLPSGAVSVGTVGVSPINGYPVSITLYNASSSSDFKYVTSYPYHMVNLFHM